MNRTNIFTIALLVTALGLAGCAGKRINKISERDLSMSASEAVRHSKDVMNDYGFDIQVIDRGDGGARLEGEHADGQDVEVEISPRSRGGSHVQIEVSNESPKTSAKKILDDIAVRYEK